MDNSVEELSQKISESIETSTLPALHTGHVPIADKIRAAAAYLLEGGNAKKAAEVAGVHHNSVLTWKQQQWWVDLCERLERDFEHDFKAHMGKIARRGLEEIEDRINNGDKILNYKTGEMETRPMSGKELATTVGIIWDKKRVMDNKPTSISDNKSTDERLHDLMDRFENMVRKDEAKVVGEQ